MMPYLCLVFDRRLVAKGSNVLVDLIITYIADGLMVRGLGVEQLVRAWLGLDLGQLVRWTEEVAAGHACT
jgi:hypothetical protein